MQLTGLVLKVGFAASYGGAEHGQRDGFMLGKDDAPSAPTSQELHHPLPIQT